MTGETAGVRHDELELTAGLAPVFTPCRDAPEEGVGARTLERTTDLIGDGAGRRRPRMRSIEGPIAIEALSGEAEHIGGKEAGVDPFKLGDGDVKALLAVGVPARDVIDGRNRRRVRTLAAFAQLVGQ